MKKRFMLMLAVLGLSLTAASPAFAATMSKPSVPDNDFEAGELIRVRSYTTPKLTTAQINSPRRSAWYYVYKLDDGAYKYVARIQAVLYNSAWYEGQTRLRASMIINRTGKYRVIAKMFRVDSDSDTHLVGKSDARYFTVEGSNGAPSYVSGPSTRFSSYDEGDDFKVTSYVKPKYGYNDISNANRKVFFYFYRKSTTAGDWVYKNKFQATLVPAADVNKTNASTRVIINQAGKWKIRAKFSWTDGNGVRHHKWGATTRYLTIED